MDYKTFVFRGRISRLTDQDMLLLQASIAEMDAHNADIFSSMQTAQQQMLALAAQIWDKTSSQYRAIKRQLIPQPPDNQRAWRKIQRQYARQKEKKQLKETNRARYQEFRARQDNAIRILQQMGYVLDEDFRRTNAITFLKHAESIPEPAFPMTDSLSMLETQHDTG